MLASEILGMKLKLLVLSIISLGLLYYLSYFFGLYMYHENKLFVIIKLFHFVVMNTFRTKILEPVLIKLTITII